MQAPSTGKIFTGEGIYFLDRTTPWFPVNSFPFPSNPRCAGPVLRVQPCVCPGSAACTPSAPHTHPHFLGPDLLLKLLSQTAPAGSYEKLENPGKGTNSLPMETNESGSVWRQGTLSDHQNWVHKRHVRVAVPTL